MRPIDPESSSEQPRHGGKLEAPGGPGSMAAMSRRRFAGTLVKGLGGAAVAAALPEALAQATANGVRRPNIVFVFSDQHSYKYTGYARIMAMKAKGRLTDTARNI